MKTHNFLIILLVILVSSCTGTYFVTDDQTRYYDDYYNSYRDYPNYNYYMWYNNIPYPYYYQYRNFYVVPQQNMSQINQQRGARPSRTVIAPLIAPSRNVQAPSRPTPNRTRISN